MEAFNILVGITTILSFVVSIIALFKVEKIEKQINNNNDVKQRVSNNDINNSNISIIGRDNKSSR